MKKIYTFLVVSLPILAVYMSPISGLDFGTFCVLIFGGLCVLRKRAIVHSNKVLILLIVYMIAITSFAIFLSNMTKYSSEFSILVRTARFVIMIIIMIGIGLGTYLEHDLLIKYLRGITLIIAVYAILQMLFFNITGLKLINVFGPTKQGVVFESMLGEYEATYRPPSLFLEPSSVTYYVVPYLCYALFHTYINKEDKKKSFGDAIIVSGSLLCTTSGQGMIVLCGLWTAWFLKMFKKIDIKKIFVGIPLTIAVLAALSSNSTVQYTIERFTERNGGSINAIDARYGGYLAYKELDVLNKVFGMGFGNYDENIYYSSIADILFCTGAIGLTLVLMLYVSLWKKGSLYQKILILATWVLMLGGGVYSATYLCFYLPILMTRDEKTSAMHQVLNDVRGELWDS